MRMARVGGLVLLCRVEVGVVRRLGLKWSLDKGIRVRIGLQNCFLFLPHSAAFCYILLHSATFCCLVELCILDTILSCTLG